MLYTGKMFILSSVYHELISIVLFSLLWKQMVKALLS